MSKFRCSSCEEMTATGRFVLWERKSGTEVKVCMKCYQTKFDTVEKATKPIRLRESTKLAIKVLGNFGDSYDGIICKMIEVYKKVKK